MRVLFAGGGVGTVGRELLLGTATGGGGGTVGGCGDIVLAPGGSVEGGRGVSTT